MMKKMMKMMVMMNNMDDDSHDVVAVVLVIVVWVLNRHLVATHLGRASLYIVHVGMFPSQFSIAIINLDLPQVAVPGGVW